MRPPLHPDMGQVVISARVARHLTAAQMRGNAPTRLPPHVAAARAAQVLPLALSPMLRFALHSLSVYLEQGMPSLTWLESVLTAAHFGSSFRRCFFFAYKEQRRAYPRVTNRGVQTSPKRRADSRRLGFGDE